MNWIQVPHAVPILPNCTCADWGMSGGCLATCASEIERMRRRGKIWNVSTQSYEEIKMADENETESVNETESFPISQPEIFDSLLDQTYQNEPGQPLEIDLSPIEGGLIASIVLKDGTTLGIGDAVSAANDEGYICEGNVFSIEKGIPEFVVDSDSTHTVVIKNHETGKFEHWGSDRVTKVKVDPFKITIDFYGEKKTLTLRKGTYEDERLAIRAYSDTGEVFGTLTVNMVDCEGLPFQDHAFAKTWSECAAWVPQVMGQLCKNHGVKTTQYTHTSGYVTAQLYNFNSILDRIEDM